MVNTSDSKPEILSSNLGAPAKRSEWFFHNFETEECSDPAKCPICRGLVTAHQLGGPNGAELYAKARQLIGSNGE